MLTELISTKHIRNHGFKDAKSFKEKYNLPYLKSNRIRKQQSQLMLEKNPTKNRKRTPEEITNFIL